MLELLIPSLYFSLCEYQSYAIGEIRIEPFKNETEAEGLVLISFCVSVSLFLHENENARMEMTTQHQKDMFNSIHYNSHELVELNLPPTSKTQDLALRKKRNKTQNKTEQNNTKQLRINVKNGVQMRLQECNKTSVLQVSATLIKIISEMFHLKHKRQSNKKRIYVYHFKHNNVS